MSVNTVVSTSEQRGKQSHSSAFGASESPEKQAKEDVKKPPSTTGPRPRSFPPVGDNVKDGIQGSSKASKSRPHSYPTALSRCSRRRPASGPSAVPTLGGTAVDLAVAGPTYRVVPFGCVLREYTHDIVVEGQFVELLPHTDIDRSGRSYL